MALWWFFNEVCARDSSLIKSWRIDHCFYSLRPDRWKETTMFRTLFRSSLLHPTSRTIFFLSRYPARVRRIRDGFSGQFVLESFWRHDTSWGGSDQIRDRWIFVLRNLPVMKWPVNDQNFRWPPQIRDNWLLFPFLKTPSYYWQVYPNIAHGIFLSC